MSQLPGGWTPLHIVCASQQLPASDICAQIKSHVQNGSDVNVGNNYDVTPLMIAAVMGHVDVVKYLVQELHADIHLQNRDGQTAYDLLRANKHVIDDEAYLKISEVLN